MRVALISDIHGHAVALLPSLSWCARRLTPTDLAFLGSFEETALLPLGGRHSMLCYHGSPRSSTDLVHPAIPVDRLEALFAGVAADVLAGGHTHLQMRMRLGDRLLVNPGSVGCVFRTPPAPGVELTLRPWAEYAVVSLGEPGGDVQARRVEFDLADFRRRVERSDIPTRKWWLSQYG